MPIYTRLCARKSESSLIDEQTICDFLILVCSRWFFLRKNGVDLSLEVVRSAYPHAVRAGAAGGAGIRPSVLPSTHRERTRAKFPVSQLQTWR